MLYEVITNVLNILDHNHARRVSKLSMSLARQLGLSEHEIHLIGQGALYVITSYSIHYTKLYDSYYACLYQPLRYVGSKSDLYWPDESREGLCHDRDSQGT